MCRPHELKTCDHQILPIKILGTLYLAAGLAHTVLSILCIYSLSWHDNLYLGEKGISRSNQVAKADHGTEINQPSPAGSDFLLAA
ncbi:hypothetical protein PVK06_022961 [Gossypium arboreum]|uniref:Uncharacterized protein n=1 Tax=Gossypium arboreum TaxID=29729 RepID=A0ABR0PA00_GOSAR|nr:hypothetical protein PVK06_022961 [Gossypium arboreum]